jgi:hypothetical protein
LLEHSDPDWNDKSVVEYVSHPLNSECCGLC